MPDVAHEGARTDYDDAVEVFCWESNDGIGVATFSIDRAYDGTPTGKLDGLPIRIYTWPEDEEPQTAWLSLEAAREVRDAIDAAILQVELTRDQRRRKA